MNAKIRHLRQEAPLESRRNYAGFKQGRHQMLHLGKPRRSLPDAARSVSCLQKGCSEKTALATHCISRCTSGYNYFFKLGFISRTKVFIHTTSRDVGNSVPCILDFNIFDIKHDRKVSKTISVKIFTFLVKICAGNLS